MSHTEYHSRQPTRTLICNADDFGFSRGISDGIVHSHLNGIISSTSLMANMPSAEYAAKLSRNTPSLGVGLHLVLTLGPSLSPPSQIPDLVCQKKEFLPLAKLTPRLRRGGARLAQQIAIEWEAQIQHASDLGFSITHCDSHHGIHKYPVCRKVLIDLMKRHNIKCVRAAIRYHWPKVLPRLTLLKRVKKVPAICGNFLNEAAYKKNEIRHVDQYLNLRYFPLGSLGTPTHLADAITSIPPGVTELAFHPGFPDDDDLYDRPGYAQVRTLDLENVTSPEVRESLDASGIELASYSCLSFPN